MTSRNKIFLTPFLFLALGILTATAQEEKKEKPSPPETLEELQTAIEAVLEDTKTPAAGIAMVDENGPVWITSLGKANVEEDKAANENTMFRIGSTSKMFVSLSILKLQEEGRISLEDEVRELVPDVWFENPWADTDPILVEHLLEHTTGWDDIHMAEYVYNPSPPVSLKEGLEYHPDSRISRWVPGTRMSYCNSGPPVAAYIVEKITGQAFEDYVQENFFGPMGMENMTYFASEAYARHGATLYDDGVPEEYWNILMRPSGSINASPKDMANMLAFFIKRGVADSMQLISETSLKRMETPSTTGGARAGVEVGYGLSNYSAPHNSFVYRAHNGGVNGGLTDFAYLPSYKVGYAIMINSGSGSALGKISKLIRNFQTRNFPTTEIAPKAEMTEEHAAIAGLYEIGSPRTQMFHFMNRIPNIQQIWCEGDTVFKQALFGGGIDRYYPANNGTFISPETGMIIMAWATDPLDGEVLHIGSRVIKRISPVLAYGQLIVNILWLLLIPITIVFGIVWVIGYCIGKVAGGANIQVRLWPLLASLFALSTVIFLFMGISDPFAHLGAPGMISISFMLSTIGFAATALWSVVAIIKHRRADLNKVAYWFSAVSVTFNFIVTCYLLYHGVIGIRTWA